MITNTYFFTCGLIPMVHLFTAKSPWIEIKEIGKMKRNNSLTGLWAGSGLRSLVLQTIISGNKDGEV